MAWLLERDSLNGKEGKAFMTIDGRNVELFQLKKFQTDADFQESDFKVIGTRLVQKKTNGMQLTGSMTIYYGTSTFITLVEGYLKGGRLPYFTLQITNDDPSTTVGSQIVAFYGVKLQKVPISILDADADFLTADVSFSFTSFEVLHAFNAPEQLGD
jgi:hypothetical protein